VLDMLTFHLFTIDAPVLVRIETSTGHRAGKPVSAVVQEAADLLAFAAEHTGLR
jgi:prolyl oligopeptidase